MRLSAQVCLASIACAVGQATAAQSFASTPTHQRTNELVLGTSEALSFGTELEREALALVDAQGVGAREALEGMARDGTSVGFAAGAKGLIELARRVQRNGELQLAAEIGLNIYLSSSPRGARLEGLRLFVRGVDDSRSRKWLGLLESGKQDQGLQAALPELLAARAARQAELSPAWSSLVQGLRAPLVVRYDQALERALGVGLAPGSPRLSLQDIMRLAQPVHARLGHSDADAYAELLQRESVYAADNQRAKRHFAARDLSGEVLDLYRQTFKLLELTPALAPELQLAYGYARGTNATTWQSATGRVPAEISLNLTALVDGRRFEASVPHELTHILQAAPGKTLLERAIHEGVATYVSLQIIGDLDRADALFWSPEEWQQGQVSFEASKHLFASLLHSEDPVVLAAFLDLDNTPDGIPGVPSRSGYLIGLCAVEAWCAANPRRPLGDVL